MPVVDLSLDLATQLAGAAPPPRTVDAWPSWAPHMDELTIHPCSTVDLTSPRTPALVEPLRPPSTRELSYLIKAAQGERADRQNGRRVTDGHAPPDIHRERPIGIGQMSPGMRTDAVRYAHPYANAAAPRPWHDAMPNDGPETHATGQRQHLRRASEESQQSLSDSAEGYSVEGWLLEQLEGKTMHELCEVLAAGLAEAGLGASLAELAANATNCTLAAISRAMEVCSTAVCSTLANVLFSRIIALRSNSKNEHVLVAADSSQQSTGENSGAVTTAKSADGMNAFNKFSGGYEGTFADISAFFGGLVQLIGEPAKDVLASLRREHETVPAGEYGASQTPLQTSNYRVMFTPQKEFSFVADPRDESVMDAGLDEEGQPLPPREKVLAETLLAEAVPRMRDALHKRGWGAAAVTHEAFAELHLQLAELIAMRLYTGPMFMLYNGVLRAMGTGGKVRFGFPAAMIGLSVKGKFTTALHCINSGILKLGRLQPACTVYRGVGGMRLPDSFLTQNAHNVMGGVEYGFMSTTVDKSVALQYSKVGPGQPSLVLEMRMGMVNRGAYLGWLSQYPQEQEILLPPLTGLEVLHHTEEGFTLNADGSTKTGTLVYKMDLNCNLQSKTIEQVLGIRKEQCVELADIVQRGIELELTSVAKDRWLNLQLDKIKRKQKEIIEAEQETFNDNRIFTQTVNELMSLVPKAGDCMAELRTEQQTEIWSVAVSSSTPSLIATTSNSNEVVIWNVTTNAVHQTLHGHEEYIHHVAFHTARVNSFLLLASASCDHSVRIWKANSEDCSFSCAQVLRGHAGDVFCCDWDRSGRLVTSSQDRTIRIWNPIDSNDCAYVLRGHRDYIRAVAWHSKKSNQLASASNDGEIRLWNLRCAQACSVENACPQQAKDSNANVAETARFKLTALEDEVREAKETLLNLKKSDFAEVKALSAPPLLLQRTMECVCILVGSPTGWRSAKRILADNKFLRQLELDGLRADSITVGTVKKLDEVIDDTLSVQNLRKISHVGAIFVRWVLAMHAYASRGAVTEEPHSFGCIDQANEPEIASAVAGLSSPTSTAELVTTLHGHGNKRVSCVRYNPQGTLLASASYDKSIRLWDATTGDCRAILSDGIQDWLQAVAWSSDGARLACAGDDRVIHVWTIDFTLMDSMSGDVRAKCVTVLEGHRGDVRSIAFLEDDRSLCSGSSDQLLLVWRV